MAPTIAGPSASRPDPLIPYTTRISPPRSWSETLRIPAAPRPSTLSRIGPSVVTTATRALSALPPTIAEMTFW
jgi:hypothetical protein